MRKRTPSLRSPRSTLADTRRPTPVSVDVSMTFIATHGGGKFLPDYSLSGLASPSVHGLL
jgi:hypothetical protein